MTKSIVSFNPARASEVVAKYLTTTPARIAQTVQEANTAAQQWAQLSIAERCERLAPLPSLLLEAKSSLAKAISLEMGKPYSESMEEVEDAAQECRYLLKQAMEVLAPVELANHDDARHRLTWHALGAIAVITPWNYPVEIAIWGLVGSLLAGNSAIFKPSEVTPMSGHQLFDLFARLDLPQGLVGLVLGDRHEGRLLVESDVAAVWFVGSEGAGLDIYARAAKTMKRCLLELGGSSPGIVFGDMVITDALIEHLFASRFHNAGQVCSAMKRLYVQKNLYSEVVDRLSQRLSSVRLADPFAAECDMGPLATSAAHARLLSQVLSALSLGARSPQADDLKHIDRPFFPPMLLTHTDMDMSVVRDEVFGPVLPVIPFASDAEAIELANASRYGLSASVFCADPVKAARMADLLEAGRVLVNSPKSPGISYPIEGFKRSGLGRHQGEFLLRELARMKYSKIGSDYLPTTARNASQEENPHEHH